MSGLISNGTYALGANIGEVSTDGSLTGTGTPDSPLGVNETVLWSGSLFGESVTASLTESVMNFETIRIEGYCQEASTRLSLNFVLPNESGDVFIDLVGHSNVGALLVYSDLLNFSSTPSVTMVSHKHVWYQGSTYYSGTSGITLTKIIGINRKQEA